MVGFFDGGEKCLGPGERKRENGCETDTLENQEWLGPKVHEIVGIRFQVCVVSLDAKHTVR